MLSLPSKRCSASTTNMYPRKPVQLLLQGSWYILQNSWHCHEFQVSATRKAAPQPEQPKKSPYRLYHFVSNTQRNSLSPCSCPFNLTSKIILDNNLCNITTLYINCQLAVFRFYIILIKMDFAYRHVFLIYKHYAQSQNPFLFYIIIIFLFCKLVLQICLLSHSPVQLLLNQEVCLQQLHK